MIQSIFQINERTAVSRSLIWFIVLSLVLGFSACKSEKAKPSYVQLAGKAQGTTFQITYKDSQSKDYSQPVDSLFRLMDHSMSVWDKSSIVTAVNAGKDVALDEHFIRVFNKGKEIHSQTEGMFDMTVGALVRRWGFSFKKNQTPPEGKEVERLMQSIGMDKVSIENGKLVKTVQNIEVDFNAIAQGYTVDLIADFLEKKGVQNYMVEVGGEVKAKGINSRNTVWNIAVDKPVEGQRQLQCIVPLKNKSLVSSGSYRKFVERDGRKYSHAINPKTGQPVTHNLLSVSVLTNGCMEADAYATAFLVMGLENTKELSTALGLDVYCVFEKEDGSFGVYASEGFEYQEVGE